MVRARGIVQMGRKVLQDKYLLKALQSEIKLEVSIMRIKDELKQYLVKKGFDKNLTGFLDLHLRKMEQGQHENWLYKVNDFIIGKKV